VVPARQGQSSPTLPNPSLLKFYETICLTTPATIKVSKNNRRAQKLLILGDFLSTYDNNMHAAYCLITNETLSQLQFLSQRSNADAPII
jgi:hypothetical protein